MESCRPVPIYGKEYVWVWGFSSKSAAGSPYRTITHGRYESYVFRVKKVDSINFRCVINLGVKGILTH